MSIKYHSPFEYHQGKLPQYRGYVLLTDSPVVLIQRDGHVWAGVPAVLPMTLETELRYHNNWQAKEYITQGMSWSGELARRNATELLKPHSGDYESDLDVTPWSDAHHAVMFDDHDAHDRWSKS